MSVGRWLVGRRENAGAEWRRSARLARVLDGSPVGGHAANYAHRMRRKLRFWDALLDLYTYPSRKSTGSES